MKLIVGAPGRAHSLGGLKPGQLHEYDHPGLKRRYHAALPAKAGARAGAAGGHPGVFRPAIAPADSVPDPALTWGCRIKMPSQRRHAIPCSQSLTVQGASH
jgi:hypothetical protein